MPVRPIRPARPIKPLTPNHRNVSPKISFPSDYSSGSMDVIDTPKDNDLLFDLYEKSSYSYDDYDSSDENWKPDPNEVKTKVDKHKYTPHTPSPYPPANETPKKRPIALQRKPKNNQPVSPSQIQRPTPPINKPTEKTREYDYYDSKYDYDSEASDQTSPQKNDKQNTKSNTNQNDEQNYQQPVAEQQQRKSDAISLPPEQDQIDTNNNNIETQQKLDSTQGNEQVSNQSNIPINNLQNREPNPDTSNQNINNSLPEAVIKPETNQVENNENINMNNSQTNDDNGEQTFQISYQSNNTHTLWKRQVNMTKNDILVYTCNPTKKDGLGKVHIIMTKKNRGLSSEYCAGMIVRHQTGTRFTLYEKSSDFSSEPQIAGISFVTPKEDRSLRQFRVAMPVGGQAYIPQSKYEDLSRIAYQNENVPGNVKVYQSAMPMKKSNGKYTLNLGNYEIVRSTKNFCIKDQNNENIFVIYKTCNNICTIKFREPFTPLIAYSIGVAITTSMK